MVHPRSIVTPFAALRFGADLPAGRVAGKSSDLSALITPPYDIVSPELRARLVARHPHNFVRVELPVEVGGGDRYASAATLLERWRREGVLVREDTAALYVLEQEFKVGDRAPRRRGVFALMRLPEKHEHYVLSHEGTLATAKADRLNLMRACRAMTSPVMVIHEDREGRLLRWLSEERGAPQAVAEEHDGVKDRLWVVRDGERVEELVAAVGEGPLAIADGHHRFETAMAYREEMKARHPDAPTEAEFNYALVLMVSAGDPALTILPAHRLISGLGAEGVAEMRARMQDAFEIEERSLAANGSATCVWDQHTALEKPAFAAYYGDNRCYVLRTRDETRAAAGSVVEALDVSIIHRGLIDPVLATCGAGQCRISYVTGCQTAVAAVDAGEAEVAVLLRPTRVGDVLAVAKAGQRMPGKSTYFYPKAPAGLVLSSSTASPIETRGGE